MLPSKEQIEKIIKALQVIMRIQDWDIKFKYVSEAEARDIYGEDCSGGNLRHQDSEESQIIINIDNQKIKEESNYWYHTLIHELYHIVTDRFIYEVDETTALITNEEMRKNLSETIRIRYEELVNKLAKGFVNAYPLDNFKELMTE
jgi:hypothetical protein